MLSIPFPYSIDKNELKAFYLSFLIRSYVVQGKEKMTAKITKRMFYDTMKALGINKSRITETWKYKKAWTFFNYVSDEFIVLRGKENVQWEKWFITRLDYEIMWFYKFCQFVTETYMQRPVTQTQEFRDTFRYKKSTRYNQEIFKRSLEKKIGRWQRKLAEQSWCTLKTVNNRAKRSERVKTVKRYSESYWLRVRKTNLYFNLDNKVYIYYNKNNTKRRSRTALKLVQCSLLENALFLNGSISLSNAYDTIYKLVPNLWIIV